MNKAALQYVREGLKRDGKDGLCCDECSCDITDLFTHCYEITNFFESDCVAGHKKKCLMSTVDCDCPCICENDPCTCGNFHMVAEKSEPECAKCYGEGKSLPFKNADYCTCPAGQKLEEK